MPITDVTKLNSAEIQGNILKGHGRDHLALVLVRFGSDPAKTRQWLQKLTTPPTPPDPNAIVVTTHAAQFAQTDNLKDNGVQSLFVNLFITKAGYAKLGKAPPSDPKFQAGLKASQPALKDPPVANWEAPFQQNADAMLLLANDHQQHLERSIAQAESDITNIAGGTALFVQHGDALRNTDENSVEHFGYVDGRSQPIFLLDDLLAEAQTGGGVDTWNPGEDAFEIVLVPDPVAADPKSFGSYFVFRKLEQNVRLFKETEMALAESLGLEGEDAERAGAMVVGRFEDGTPVVLQQNDGLTKPVPNNFTYATDPQGSRCPVQGHIRKVNPRNGSEKPHRIARRGIPFGHRDTDMKDRPEKDVGLLFMCFQKDISSQFEFLQQIWANNENFPKPGTGVDGVIGQTGGAPASPQPWPTKYGDDSSPPRAFDFANFVTMKGGEYFFCPSISGIKKL
jgi:Dyp-type peroxidase family